MDMNELHSPGMKPAPWLYTLQLSYQACPGNRVPGSKGPKDRPRQGGCLAVPWLDGPRGRLHTRLDVKLAPFMKC